MLVRLFQRNQTNPASEKRFHPSQEPPEWFGGGWGTTTGQTVTPDTALTISAYYGGVRVLAETLAMLPLQLYQKQDRGRRMADESYLQPLLHEAPNPEMTSFEWRETLMGHVVAWGNGFSEIDWDNAGRIRALWPIPPNRVRLERKNGQLIYIVTLPKPDANGNREYGLSAYRVLHVRGLGSNGLVGYTPVQLHRQALGLALATEEFGARWFGNGAIPGGVLEHPSKLSDKSYDRLKDSWQAAHGGLSNAHRTAILEEGTKYHQIGVPPEDSQFLETRKFQVSEIARLLRLPPHKIGDLTNATFSNIEHQAIEFVTDTMLPWLVRWEQRLLVQLLLPSERADGYYIKFNANALLRGDTQSRFQAYATARQWGWLSANDVRELEDQNPIDGGDTYMMPLNMVPVGSDATRSAEEGGEKEKRSASAGEEAARMAQVENGVEIRAKNAAKQRHRLIGQYARMFTDTFGRVMRRERNDVMAQAKKSLPKRTVSDFQNFLDQFYRDHEGWVFDQVMPVYDSYLTAVRDAVGDEVGKDATDTDMDKFLRSYVGSFARRYSRKQYLDLTAKLDQWMAEKNADELADALDGLFGEWMDERPSDYAGDETVRANNGFAKGLYGALGFLTVRWVNTGESCPYCDSLDGMTIEINSWFLDTGDYQPDGAEQPIAITSRVGHPPAHRGCDCMIVAG